jgi:hypothetical protein
MTIGEESKERPAKNNQTVSPRSRRLGVSNRLGKPVVIIRAIFFLKDNLGSQGFVKLKSSGSKRKVKQQGQRAAAYLFETEHVGIGSGCLFKASTLLIGGFLIQVPSSVDGCLES